MDDADKRWIVPEATLSETIERSNT